MSKSLPGVQGAWSEAHALGKGSYLCRSAMGQEGNIKHRFSLLWGHVIFHILTTHKLGYILQFMTNCSLIDSPHPPPPVFLMEHKIMVCHKTNGALEIWLFIFRLSPQRHGKEKKIRKTAGLIPTRASVFGALGTAVPLKGVKQISASDYSWGRKTN